MDLSDLDSYVAQLWRCKRACGNAPQLLAITEERIVREELARSAHLGTICDDATTIEDCIRSLQAENLAHVDHVWRCRAQARALRALVLEQMAHAAADTMRDLVSLRIVQTGCLPVHHTGKLARRVRSA